MSPNKRSSKAKAAGTPSLTITPLAKATNLTAPKIKDEGSGSETASTTGKRNRTRTFIIPSLLSEKLLCFRFPGLG